MTKAKGFKTYDSSVWAQANAKLKKELDIEIRKVFVEHNLGNTGSHALSNEESRRLVNRVGQRFEELKTDHSKLKVIDKPYVEQAVSSRKFLCYFHLLFQIYFSWKIVVAG